MAKRELNEGGLDERIVRAALQAYPIVSTTITFLRHNENMAFRVVDGQTSETYLLRVHVPLTEAFQGERQQPEMIASELCWLEALANETELVLQRPVRTKNGELVALVEGYQEEIPCSLLHWLEGEPFPDIPSTVQAARLGMVVATLHTHARTWTIPEAFTRPTYDLVFHERQINKLASGVDMGVIREKDFATIQRTLARVLAVLSQAQESLLLIHADLHRGNLLADGDAVYPIDFSLSGFGLPLFDLGTCLTSLPSGLRSACLEAYQQRETLPSAFPLLIDACFLLSRMGAYVYMLPNSAEHAWLKERIPRFVAQECQLFLAGRPLLFGGPF